MQNSSSNDIASCGFCLSKEEITEQKYNQFIKQTVSFLKGKTESVVKYLNIQMEKLSNNMEYGEFNFPAEYYLLNFVDYQSTGILNYFIEPDYWSMVKDGVSSSDLLSRYSTIIEITTSDDYDLYEDYPNHLDRIDNWLASGNKNYILADKIRNELLDKGILIEDKDGKTTWKIK